MKVIPGKGFKIISWTLFTSMNLNNSRSLFSMIWMLNASCKMLPSYHVVNGAKVPWGAYSLCKADYLQQVEKGDSPDEI
jgi:hypothetical protein